jgi:hypothetical protein
MRYDIKIGYHTFVSDGGEEFGAIRDIFKNGELVVYVGDFVVPLDAMGAWYRRTQTDPLRRREPDPLPWVAL